MGTGDEMSGATTCRWVRVHTAEKKEITLVSVPNTFWWAGWLDQGAVGGDVYSYIQQFTCTCKNTPQSLLLLHFEPALQIFWARFVEGNHVCSTATAVRAVSLRKCKEVKVVIHKVGLKYMGVVALCWRFEDIPTTVPICWDQCSGAIPLSQNYFFPVDYLYRIGCVLVESLKQKWPVLVFPYLLPPGGRIHSCAKQTGRADWIGCKLNFQLIPLFDNGVPAFVNILHAFLKESRLLKGGNWVYTVSCSHEITNIQQRIMLPSQNLQSLVYNLHSSELFPLGTYRKKGKNIVFPQYNLHISAKPAISCCLKYFFTNSLHHRSCCKTEKMFSLSFRSHHLPGALLQCEPLRLAYPCEVYESNGIMTVKLLAGQQKFIFFWAYEV